MNSTAQPLEAAKFIFTWIDYSLFVVLLAISVIIGIYFGFFENKQNSTVEYLLAGKRMHVIPVAASLIASYISGITLLAVPADIYKFGASYFWICFSMTISCAVAAFIYLPVFFKLQYATIFEYLHFRFDKKTSVLASFLFALTILSYNPIVIYIPALAFSQATGINVHFITPVMSGICIFYTTIGGLKAVVWTDTLQFVGIIGSVITIFFMGISSVGGLDFIISKGLESGRLDIFNFQLDPIMRDSVWAYVIGGTLHWISLIAVSPGSLQKYLAVPSLRQAQKVLGIYCIGMVFLTSISVFTGLILYAKYHDCDPLKSQQIGREDQILPFFVMNIGGNVPGMPGIFIGGVFSAALSSLSATLNTISGTIYRDFILPFMPPKTTEKTSSNIMKLIVVIAGIVCILLVFVIEHMGSLLALVTALQGVIGGPTIAIFTLGVLFPIANAKGAFYGGLFGLVSMFCLVFTNQYYAMNGMLDDFSKPTSTEGCSSFVDAFDNRTHLVSHDKPNALFRITFWYYTFIGTVLTLISGLIISWLTFTEEDYVDPEFISPISHFMIPYSKRYKLKAEMLKSNVTEQFVLNEKEKDTLLNIGNVNS